MMVPTKINNGLENKIVVKQGDFVMLSSLTGKIGGFVVDLTPKTIKLSHEYPFNMKPGNFITDESGKIRYYCPTKRILIGRRGISRGDRTYHLRKFDNYQVLWSRKSDKI